MTMVCVPIAVEDIDPALADAAEAKRRGADLVELRIDPFFQGSEGDTEDALRVAQLQRLLAECPLPVLLTCRSALEGGDYDGDDADRVSLLEKLTAACDTPPAYLDFELAAYTRSANIRQKINLCVAHPKQARGLSTRLILSVHDFHGIPPDVNRRLLTAYQEPACAVVKLAVRARSLRDNLTLFDILEGAPKPTIALGMGEFGLLSRVLAPKFRAPITFAALRPAAATAPGQPTLDDLLHLYRFRSIGRDTRLYGVIGWPLSHSLSPLVHNAGFDAIGWDGVYLPLPIAADPDDPTASDLSYRATLDALYNSPPLGFSGASVTIPHKEHALRHALQRRTPTPTPDPDLHQLAALGAINTISGDALSFRHGSERYANTDIQAVLDPLSDALGPLAERRIALIGAGGVARPLALRLAQAGAEVLLFNRSAQRAGSLAQDIARSLANPALDHAPGRAIALPLDALPASRCDAYINCTPLGMAGGPDPTALAAPIHDMPHLTPATLFFDTVYNPVQTPMLRAAAARGCRTINGLDMFVRQAAAQFQLWTGSPPPQGLFERLCRDRLGQAPRA